MLQYDSCIYVTRLIHMCHDSIKLNLTKKKRLEVITTSNFLRTWTGFLDSRNTILIKVESMVTFSSSAIWCCLSLSSSLSHRFSPHTPHPRNFDPSVFPSLLVCVCVSLCVCFVALPRLSLFASLSFFLSLSLFVSVSFSHTLTHTHTLSLSFSHSFSLSLPFSLSLSLSLYRTRTHTHTQTHTHTHTHTNTHTITHTRCRALHRPSLVFSRFLSLSMNLYKMRNNTL